MKLPPVFTLTKPEQRIVIVILVALVAGMWIKRKTEPRFAPAPQSTTAETTPALPESEEDDEATSETEN